MSDEIDKLIEEALGSDYLDMRALAEAAYKLGVVDADSECRTRMAQDLRRELAKELLEYWSRCAPKYWSPAVTYLIDRLREIAVEA